MAVVESTPAHLDAEPLAVYHVADRAAHGYVYRALLREPGLVLLEDASLHALVYTETAGRGDAAAYRREARRAHGPLGEYVAEQTLRGLAGQLQTLAPLAERLWAASLGVLALSDAAFQAAGQRLGSRRVARVTRAAEELAPVLLALAGEVFPGREAARDAFRTARADEETLIGSALGELRPFAREIGLAELPGEIRALLAPLLVPPAR